MVESSAVVVEVWPAVEVCATPAFHPANKTAAHSQIPHRSPQPLPALSNVFLPAARYNHSVRRVSLPRPP